ncbi:MAG: oxidoreductase [Mycobacteriaceae bacterium]|nr:oxidoreductase [Mycobacteriaceae bacterium]
MTSPHPSCRSRSSEVPSLAVWKFASCDGCQLTLLDCEDELLILAEQVQIATFAEASSAMVGGPYDVSLVEGSITTPSDERRIREIREQSGVLVAIGACATAGGIQALRNFADVAEFASVVYARPDYIHTLAALLVGRKPRLPAATVCTECKRSGVTCVAVAEGIPCLGPVTHAGCGALCPKHNRGCFGCFGPTATPNMPAMIPLLRRDGMSGDDVDRVFSTFHVNDFTPLMPEGSGS